MLALMLAEAAHSTWKLWYNILHPQPKCTAVFRQEPRQRKGGVGVGEERGVGVPGPCNDMMMSLRLYFQIQAMKTG